MTENIKNIQGSKGGCFPAGTFIKTSDGHKSIEKFKTGDNIIAFDNDGDLISAKVIEIHKHLTKDLRGDKLVGVNHSIGKTFIATANHWVFTKDKQFKELGDFKVGEYLTLSNKSYSQILSIDTLPDQAYVYNLTVDPFNTFVANNILVHNKGGGKEVEAPYVPIEDPNSLQSNATVRVLDLLCEGEIQGLVNGDRSIYLNNIQLRQDGGEYNFSGISTYTDSRGTPDQFYIPGLTDESPSITVINTELTYDGGGISYQVTDTDIDNIRVVINVPALMSINEQGDIKETGVTLAIDIQPDGEGWQNEIVRTEINGKCTSTYQRAIRIDALDGYGDGPWIIRIRRLTEDSGSPKLVNATWWYSIVEIKDRRVAYRDRAIVGIKVDVKSFGTSVPTRSYDIYGLKIKVPNNRTYDAGTDSASYAGEWTGTFKTEWCDNPAWVLYDILNKDRYGLGLDASYIDKWALYTISVYCDTQVDDGFGSTERRFTFNGVINNRVDAMHLINMIASNCRIMPFWAGGVATFIQDSPKDATKLITAANVENGVFNYTGTALKDRHTVVHVSWNDPDDFFRLAVEVVEDVEGILRYGYKSMDVLAYGCSSRGQAYRFGKWILESELNETEIVKFSAGLDSMDVLPGEIINIADPHNALNNRFGGRTVSATVNSLTIDNTIDLSAGETYAVSMVSPDGSLETKDLTNTVPSSDVEVLTWGGNLSGANVPQTDSMWLVTASDLAPKPYRVLKIAEVETNKYEVTAVEHDPTKFARVEDGIYLEAPAYINIPAGELIPPTNIDLDQYSYIDDISGNYKFGIMISCTLSSDPRTLYYEIQSKEANTAYRREGQTSTSSFTIKNVVDGTWTIRIRGISLAVKSPWLVSDPIEIVTISDIQPPTNLQIRGGGTTWSGVDCEIEWNASTGARVGNKEIDKNAIIGYKIGVYRDDDIFLRNDYIRDGGDGTAYTYYYNWNVDDNNAIGQSLSFDLKFKVWTVALQNTISDDFASLTADHIDIPNITGLQVLGGGTTFSGADCEIEWDNLDAVFKDYRVKVYTVGDVLLRTEYAIDNKYVYTFNKNEADTDGTALRQIKFKLRGRDGFNQVSLADATLVANNPAPSMAGNTPTITALFKGLKIDWSNIKPADNDGYKFIIYSDTDNPPTTTIAEVGWNTTFVYSFDLDTDDLYYTKIEPFDGFGVGSASNVSAGVQPLKIGAVDIDIELSQSIIISDSEATASGTLIELYDRIKDSGGPTYDATSSGTAWIEYDFGIENFIDRVSIWGGIGNFYVAYRRIDEGWSYLKAEGDHTLDNDGELLIATDQNDAQTNYLTTTSGLNTLTFPQRVIANECRLYIYDCNVQIYELIFMREIIAEQVTADNLSSISADIGAIAAGTIQSQDWGSSDGTFIDLSADGYIKLGGSSSPKFYWNGNNSTLNIAAVVTFESASSGYSNISDKPTDLGDINAGEGSKLGGIEAGANVTATHTSNDTSNVSGLAASRVAGWAHGSDTTKINGGDIYTNTITASAINGAGFGTLTISSGKIVINTADALEITAGGNIKILAGGDIEMTPSDSNPSLIRFGSIYLMGSSATISTNYGLNFWPVTPNTGRFYVGRKYDSSASYFTYIGLFSRERTFFWVEGSGTANIELHARMDSALRAQFQVQVNGGVNCYNRLVVRYSNSEDEIRFYKSASVSFFGPWNADQKTIDLARSGQAWDDAYADDWNNIGDFYHLDDYDDLAAINSIKKSEAIDERTGLPLIDDDTIPEWMLVKYKSDGENTDDDGNVLNSWKSGEIVRDNDNKPWLSNKMMFSLFMGAIKQLDQKIEQIKEIG